MTTSNDTTDQSAGDLAVAAARVLAAENAADVIVLEVRAVSSIADYFVVANGSNRRLVRRLAEVVEEQLKSHLDEAPVRTEGEREQEWILLDYGNVVIHIFLDEIRAFYEIERLYNDVPVIDWRDQPATESTVDESSE